MGLRKRALKAMFPRNKWRILKGDSVMITAGKDAGQTGIVSKVHRDPKSPGVTVKGMNLVMPRSQQPLTMWYGTCKAICEHLLADSK